MAESEMGSGAILAVDEALDAFLRAADLGERAAAPARYALGLDSPLREHRGKRVRPVLCLLVTDALGGSLPRAMPLAVSCEFLHAFLLTHDDIADGDEHRRGRASVWRRFGVAAAINTGDLLAALATRAILRAPWEPASTLCLLNALDVTLAETGVGQAMDLDARGRAIDRAAYMAIAHRKTASYLAFPMTGAALLAGAGDEVAAALGRYAAHVGPMFQVIDDLVDLTTGKGRLAPGSDIREGKPSAAVVVALERASPADAESLLGILRLRREETTDADVAWVLALFERLEAREGAMEMARAMLVGALDALAPLPPPVALRLGEVARALLVRET